MRTAINSSFKKILLLLTLTLVHHLLQAQSPLNYGKSRNIFFLSQRDIHRMGIEHIYSVTATPDESSWEFFDINFTDSSIFRNNWCQALDDGSRIPSLDSLIMDSGEGYINGEFYAIKSGKIEAAGMSGRGALCYWSYAFGKKHSIATEGCKYQEYDNKRKIVYFPNGLVNYKTCCQTLDAEGKPISKASQIQPIISMTALAGL